MRVFMLGWEFPPFISGGLGTACYGLTKAMSSLGTDIMFVLPRPVSTPFSTHVRLVSPRPGSPLAGPSTEFRLDEFDHVTFRAIDSALANPYATGDDYARQSRPDLADALGAGGPGAQYQVLNPGATGAALLSPLPPGSNYAGDLFGEIQRYAALATEIARHESFDV